MHWENTCIDLIELKTSFAVPNICSGKVLYSVCSGAFHSPAFVQLFHNKSWYVLVLSFFVILYQSIGRKPPHLSHIFIHFWITRDCADNKSLRVGNAKDLGCTLWMKLNSTIGICQPPVVSMLCCPWCNPYIKYLRYWTLFLSPHSFAVPCLQVQGCLADHLTSCPKHAGICHSLASSSAIHISFTSGKSSSAKHASYHRRAQHHNLSPGESRTH